MPSTGGAYLAGSDGTIWRAPGFSADGRWAAAHPVKPRRFGGRAGASRRGRYLSVFVNVGGLRRECAVHRMVAEAWLPGFHPFLVVHHVNGDPEDNRPANLRCMLRTEHERLHGTQVTDADVTLERCLFEEELAKAPAPPRMRREERARGPEAKRLRGAGRLKRIIAECEEIKEKEDGRE